MPSAIPLEGEHYAEMDRIQFGHAVLAKTSTGLPEMTKTSAPYEDWLKVAASPADPELYFLGTFDQRITFYSQQVRGLRLAHALHLSNALKTSGPIAVVGAGAAGVTAALALALIGSDVTLYDPAETILQLQSASPRLLHPHIYEWPHLGSLDSGAGLPILNWSANKGGVVCKDLQIEFDAAKSRLEKLIFERAHRLTSLHRSAGMWELEFKKNRQEIIQREFKHVVLAIGFGDEIPCGVATPVHYWKHNSTVSTADEPNSPASYFVSGNGDGGLTDLLNILVKQFDHVEFTRRFLDFFSDDALRLETLAVYKAVPDGENLETAFNGALLPLLNRRGVLDRLKPILRTDREVIINSTKPLFSAGKAAQLNQVMVFAVLEAAKKLAIPIQRSSGEVDDVIPVGSRFQIKGPTVDGAPLDNTIDNVVLRHGPNRAERFQPIGAHLQTYKAHVDGLFAVQPELLAPPSLAPETYDFFEGYRIEKLESSASQQTSRLSVANAKFKIVIEFDSAIHVPVERGSRLLKEIANDCELLSNNVVVHFSLLPKDIANPLALVRLALASGGRILLEAEAAVLFDWRKLSPSIKEVPTAVPRYPARTLDLNDLGATIDASLMRMLDKRISNVLTTGECYGVGAVAPTIINAIGPTWSLWRTSLQADKTLLSAFLRWLTHVEQAKPSPWDGKHEVLPLLETALVMMLATHEGEPLEPAIAERGNLKCRLNAIALGSGCQSIGNQLIDIWDQPDQWDVDALILSGSAEVKISELRGYILDGGTPKLGMLNARRVRPVVIQNDRNWRTRLQGDLTAWKTAVATEFAELRIRQDKELMAVSK